MFRLQTQQALLQLTLNNEITLTMAKTKSKERSKNDALAAVDDDVKSMHILALGYHLFTARFREYALLSLSTLIPLAFVQLILYFFPGDALFSDVLFNGYYYFIFRFCIMVLMFLMSMVGEGAMIRLTADLYAENTVRFWPSIESNLRTGLRAAPRAAYAGVQIYLEVFFVFVVFCMVDFGIAAIPGLSDKVSGLLRCLVGLFFAFPFMHIITGPFLFFTSIIVENEGSSASVKRSWKLAKERIYFMFNFIFPLGFIRLMMADLFIYVFINYHIFPTLAGYITVVTIPTILFLPFQAILRFALYARLRIEKEDLSEVSLQAELRKPGEYINADVVSISDDDSSEGDAKVYAPPNHAVRSQNSDDTPPEDENV